jgi:hypothetical protein
VSFPVRERRFAMRAPLDLLCFVTMEVRPSLLQ